MSASTCVCVCVAVYVNAVSSSRENRVHSHWWSGSSCSYMYRVYVCLALHSIVAPSFTCLPTRSWPQASSVDISEQLLAHCQYTHLQVGREL